MKLIGSASALIYDVALLQLQDGKKVDKVRQIKPLRKKVETTTPPEGAVMRQRKPPAPDEGIISDVGALSALARQGRNTSHSSQLPLRKKALPGQFPSLLLVCSSSACCCQPSALVKYPPGSAMSFKALHRGAVEQCLDIRLHPGRAFLERQPFTSVMNNMSVQALHCPPGLKQRQLSSSSACCCQPNVLVSCPPGSARSC